MKKKAKYKTKPQMQGDKKSLQQKNTIQQQKPFVYAMDWQVVIWSAEILSRMDWKKWIERNGINEMDKINHDLSVKVQFYERSSVNQCLGNYL